MANELTLSLACSNYDRTVPLQSGEVRPKGINLIFMPMSIEEIFWRQLLRQDFDVSEMSLSSYLMARDQGTPDLIAIPVFPSRFFRHFCFYINSDRGIREPKDLVGKKIGVPEYQMTAALMGRGMLLDEYGVHPRDMHWFQGGAEHPGRVEKLPLEVPGVRIDNIGEHQTLSQMLLDGELDAMLTARAPSTFYHPSGKVQRLFPDFQRVEEAYFQKTRIFPIMHTIVLRGDLYRQHPWVAQNLYTAFSQSKAIALGKIREAGILSAAYPWLVAGIERTIEVMGEDYWPYGVEKNRKTLETAIEYSYREGMIKRRFAPEEVFIEVSEQFLI